MGIFAMIIAILGALFYNETGSSFYCDFDSDFYGI